MPHVTADDHTLVGREGADQSSTERDVYAFYSLKGLFGHCLSPTKTTWEVAEVFRTLGLECDTVQQAWLVPADKRAEYIHIAEVLTRQLAEGSPDPWALSRFAGKTVCHRRACDTLKCCQCLQHAVLTNRKLHREAVPTDHRWWMEKREDRRPLSRRLRQLLSEEVAVCVALVAKDQVHRFVSDEHALLRADSGRVQLFTTPRCTRSAPSCELQKSLVDQDRRWCSAGCHRRRWLRFTSRNATPGSWRLPAWHTPAGQSIEAPSQCSWSRTGCSSCSWTTWRCVNVHELPRTGWSG